jgi:hypothetical protein
MPLPLIPQWFWEKSSVQTVYLGDDLHRDAEGHAIVAVVKAFE